MEWIPVTSPQKPPDLVTLFLRINDPIFNDEYYFDVGCWFEQEQTFKTTMIMSDVIEPKRLDIDDVKVKVSHWCLPIHP